MIFTANLKLDDSITETPNLPKSEAKDKGIVIIYLYSLHNFSEWTKFEGKKKKKVNRKEERTKNLVNTDSLIFSQCIEETRGRRHYYGNLRWNCVRLEKWDLNGNPKRQYYRDIRRNILKSLNSNECSADTLTVRNFQKISHCTRNSLQTPV